MSDTRVPEQLSLPLDAANSTTGDSEAAVGCISCTKKQVRTAHPTVVSTLKLTAAFVAELKSRCGAMSDDQKRALILELFAQDVQAGLDAAVAEKRQELVRFVERLWDKYRVTLTSLRTERAALEEHLDRFLVRLSYR